MAPMEHFRTIGERAIAAGGGKATPLPWDFAGTVFRCAWEYPVADFEAEVGFYLDVLGFNALALDEEYALFSTAEGDLTFACRRYEHASGDYTGHILCFMTNDIATFTAALASRVGESAIATRAGSPVQTVLRISSPAGVQIDIWEFPS